MERNPQQRVWPDCDESPETTMTADHDDSVFGDLADRMLPKSDAMIRETLEEHQTEAQGE
jgi:hypothetical protein